MNVGPMYKNVKPLIFMLTLNLRGDEPKLEVHICKK